MNIYIYILYFFYFFFFGGGGDRVGQGGYERRSEAFVKIQKKWGGRVGLGQGGCERRSEAFGGGSGWM